MRIIAAGMLTNGAGLLLLPGRYTTGSFAVLKQVAPLRAWGAAWIIAGVLTMVSRRPWAMFIAIGTSASFTVGYAAAVATGQTQAPTTWVPSAVITALLLWRTGQLEEP